MPDIHKIKSRLQCQVADVRQHPSKLLIPLTASALVVIFFLQYVITGNRMLLGDFDYYSQLYEAGRISLLHYHQLPFWNPWLSGGLPLFADPQVGMISLQSLLVIPFGVVYGLKLAYLCYALAGFWGMYVLARRSLQASRVRSYLVAYIWVFGGFFAGHTIAHVTFTSFFLFPWLVYLLFERTTLKRAWLWLGLLVGIITLSSIHYAFLMMLAALAAYFVISSFGFKSSKGRLAISAIFAKKDLWFFLKTLATFIVVAGWQLALTYLFESNNQRDWPFGETLPSLKLMFEALFLPVGTVIAYPKTSWGWGEYSMAMGLGVLLALMVVAYGLIRHYWRRPNKNVLLINKRLVIICLVFAVVAVGLALGDRGTLSPFHILHKLPGFSETRVPSRWLIFVVFGLLTLLAGWRRNYRIVNVLLAASVLELFLTNGPFRQDYQAWIQLPAATFAPSLSQYDNHKVHVGDRHDPMNYYYYTTSKNVGQIYADDPLVNTLSGYPPITSGLCANNVDKPCQFVRTSNAVLVYWSPNKLQVKRTAPGDIVLNMNVEGGWQVNGTYPFTQNKKIDPTRTLTLTGNNRTYTLVYAPKLSPSWFIWRLERAF